MKKLLEPTVLIIMFVAGFVLGYNSSHGNSEEGKVLMKKEVRVDTVMVASPTPKSIAHIKYIQSKLPVVDTIKIKGDDVVTVDSIYVRVPITQKVYSDSLYKAWVSGYQQNLDSIQLYNKTTSIIFKEQKKEKWSLGVQVGITYNPKTIISPYIGLGVSYNLVTW